MDEVSLLLIIPSFIYHTSFTEFSVLISCKDKGLFVKQILILRLLAARIRRDIFSRGMIAAHSGRKQGYASQASKPNLCKFVSICGQIMDSG